MTTRSLLLFLTIFSVSLCRWSTPVRLAHFSTGLPRVEQVYRDPVTSLNHAIILGYHDYTYLAVADNGTVVSNVTFEVGVYNSIRIILRGAGDGKHLFVLYNFEARLGDTQLMFSESVDGGYHWSDPTQVHNHLELRDAVYIPQTGRLHIFCVYIDQLMPKMVTKDLDSPVFSEGVALGDSNLSPRNQMAATYNMFLGKPFINLLFWNFTKLEYYTGQMISRDSGATWSQPKLLSKGTLVPDKLLSSKRGGSVYLTYWNFDHAGLNLMRSENYGSTFRQGITLSDNTNGVYSSLALCEGLQSSLLAGLFPKYTGRTMKTEYKMWNTTNMEPHVMEHPFTMPYVDSTRLSCQVDAKKGARYIAAFVMVGSMKKTQDLYFAVDSDKFPGEARDT